MAGRKSTDSPKRFDETEITERQGDVLKMVVGGYIDQAQPISSFYIIENFDVGLSSATIRSVFADLERKGYLYSPHRSSGRVPTEKAYRFFVENLDRLGVGLIDEDQRKVQSEYLKHQFRMPEILDVTSKVLSMLTSYAAVVLSPEPEQAVLKHIELIDMGQDEVLVILVTRSGAVYSRSVFLENRIPGDTLRQISRRLNERFKGMDLAEMRTRLQGLESQAADSLRLSPDGIDGEQQYLPMIARTIADNFDPVREKETVYTAGLDQLYSQLAASGRGPKRLNELGELFDSHDFLRGIFKKSTSLDDIDIVIQGDVDDRFDGLSIISASYKMGEKNIGSLGVVGPNRMDYVRVMGTVEYIRRLISNMITRISN
ncbi:MAG: heat-inducible transcriptional repressor HrcA [bacterium]|nr:heat-inducible transcriptional repressor HrcA [bacterium]